MGKLESKSEESGYNPNTLNTERNTFMNDKIIPIIQEIINRFGQEILENYKQFNGLLQDYCLGEYKADQHILLLALKKDIPAKLNSLSTGAPLDYIINQQAHLLKTRYHIDEEAAKEAVQIWAAVFGLLNGQSMPSNKKEIDPIPNFIPDLKNSLNILTVGLDSSVDFHTLQDAIKAAGPKTTIYLKQGSYILDEGILLKRPLSIIGDGMDFTHVLAKQGDYIIRYEGDGLLKLMGIGMRWIGVNPNTADVITVYKGEVHIEGCRISGAISNIEKPGTGIVFKRNVHGVVKKCIVCENGIGIGIGDHAQPLLEDNICQENKSSGISYFGSAAGIARRNTCIRNEKYGIYVSKQACPNLDENICQENKWSGIAYSGSAAGTALHNTCTQNQQNGISIGKQAQPVLEENTCQENLNCGILYGDSAAGTALNNISRRNENHGIFIFKQAEPSLEENKCVENKRSGIAYSDNASGTAFHNTCTQNLQNGISIGELAQPVLDENTCQENKECGIYYNGSAAGTACGNTCIRNEKHGIYVGELAHPLIEENICQQNKLAGIIYFGSAVGTARHNTCMRNENQGIYIDKQAQPNLEKNICHENKDSGIFYFGNASGIAQLNNCLWNGGYGIYIGAQAHPRLIENICNNNKIGDIYP